MRLVVIDAYGIAVLSFMGLVLTVGILTSFLVKKSSKRYMVAGKSLPLFFVGTMLSRSINRWKFIFRKCCISLSIWFLGRRGNSHRLSFMFNFDRLCLWT